MILNIIFIDQTSGQAKDSSSAVRPDPFVLLFCVPSGSRTARQSFPDMWNVVKL